MQLDQTELKQKQLSKLFLRKCVRKICSNFKGEHPCQSVISIKLLCNFIEITLRHGCPPVNLLHICIDNTCRVVFVEPTNIYIYGKKPISFSKSHFLLNEAKINLTKKIMFHEPFPFSIIFLWESKFTININLFLLSFLTTSWWSLSVVSVCVIAWNWKIF